MTAGKLDFDELMNRPAVRKVRARVEALTSLPVNIRHMSQWKPTDPSHPAVLPSPAMHPTDTSFDVYLNETLPEQMAVHELLHIVLVGEGYPDIRLHASRTPAAAPQRGRFEGFADSLVNKLQHPEVYRRMAEEYSQDMQPYQAHVSAGLVNPLTFDLDRGPLSFPFGKQTALVDIIDHLYLQPGSRAALDRYQAASPDTFAAAEALKREIDQVGLRTPQDGLRCMKLFNEHVIRFGEAIGVGLDNHFWRALEWFLPEK